MDELNKSKDKLFSIIAHDLKNPFNALIGYTDILKNDIDSFSKTELKSIMIDLNKAAENGFNLLENLLHWSRTQTNMIKVYKTKFNLYDLCKDVKELNKKILSDKNQKLEIDINEEINIYADKDMIATVLRNLTYNAIKFSGSGKTIHANCKKTSEGTKISIIDQGIGINPKDLDHIFQYDKTISSVGTDGEKGSGLGLIICRDFIEMNGGRIWVESTSGKGSTFTFIIPDA